MIKGPLRKSAPVSQPEANPKNPLLLNNPFQRENPMSEITSLVTAEAVKEVRSALKQKLRQNLESRLDAEVDAILDELLGVAAVPEPEGIAGDGSASDGGEPTPDSDMMM
ncbi:DUF826 domain-containing protein [Shigella boydii]|nr:MULTISPECIES: DUF826 domain-containing protein [Shigella]EFY9072425.1 DUF826 domain-containing protein [Shigella dysenteriae]EFY9720099.1 DUF826 domain-containing protein [Shigella sonnei]HAY9090817.1 DUF826 domain-containing protein [Shigella flexneri]EFP6103343.1 DUF826 domain-containing protein [Shigella boydii]EFP7895926.1 DUF826 domain-containing protein [Shigella boydii]